MNTRYQKKNNELNTVKIYFNFEKKTFKFLMQMFNFFLLSSKIGSFIKYNIIVHIFQQQIALYWFCYKIVWNTYVKYHNGN